MTTDGFELEASFVAAKPVDDALEARRLHAAMRERLLGRRADPPRVGRYVVLRRRGAGGMGVVYEAYDPVLDRKVALKSVAIANASDDELAGEGRAMAQVVHANVVRVFDVWREHDALFIAMELVEGRTLEQWLRVAQRSRAEIVAAFVAAGHGLAAVHAEGLVHGDVKPANVLVTDDPRGAKPFGRVLLGDFGLATLGDEDARARGGTPAFMAPEQRTCRIASARADQYAFCAGLVDALTGPGRRADAARLGLGRALERGLAHAPDARWPSMHALLDAIADASTRARRNRRTAIAGIVGLAALALTWRPLPSDACGTFEHRAEERWAAAVPAVEQAFLATGLPDAARTFAQVELGARAYATQWDEASMSLCRASYAGDLDDDASERRRRCLDRALIGFTATADRWTTASIEQIDLALDALAALPEVEHCARAEHDRGLPIDPDKRRRVLELHDELERSKALAAAGDYAEAEAMVAPLVAIADGIGFAPTSAEARTLRGTVRDDLGDHLGASNDLVEAFTQAYAAGRDELAARPALELAYIFGVRLSEPERGSWWLRHAQAASLRLDDAKLRARALVIEGELAASRGDLEPARALVERGQRAIEAAHGPRSAANGHAIGLLGTAELALGHRAEAIALLERSCEILIESRGRMDPRALGCAHNLATAQAQRGDWAAARGSFEELVELWAAREPRANETALAHANLGSLLTNLGDAEAGRVHVERALAIMRDAGLDQTEQAASLRVNLGHNARVRGDVAEGRAQVQAALATFQRIGLADTRAAALAHQHLGELAMVVGDTEAALAELERGRSILTALDPDHPDLALVQANIGGLRMERDEMDEAIASLAVAERLLAAHWQLPDRLAYTRYVLAYALGERNEAGDEARARELAAFALAHYDTADEAQAAEIRAWLSARRAPLRTQ